MTIAGSGTGFTFPPLSNLALGRAKRENVGSAADFYCVRQVIECTREYY